VNEKCMSSSLVEDSVFENWKGVWYQEARQCCCFVMKDKKSRGKDQARYGWSTLEVVQYGDESIHLGLVENEFKNQMDCVSSDAAVQQGLQW
jgi:hypothetical protein